MIDELYRLALDTLRRHLAAAGVPFTEDDGDLVFLGHRLGLSIGFEGFATQGGQAIAPLDVQIHLDGDQGDRFRVGALGVGDDRPSAMRAGVEEWHLLAADPVLAALGAEAAARRRGTEPRQLAGWDFFPGRAGVRGRIPPGLQPAGPFFRQLLEVLRRRISQWRPEESPELRSIFIMATVADGRCEVQAAVDGFVDQPLCDELAALGWPHSAEAYLLKQLFVLRRA